MFITCCGPECFNNLKTLLVPAKPSEKSYEEIKEVLTQYYAPDTVEIAERYHFYKRDQGHESIAEYVLQIKKLATHCNFNTFLKEALRNQLVCGTNNEAIRQKLLAEKDLTLDKAYSTALAIEAAQKQSSQIQEQRDIHKVNFNSSKSVVNSKVKNTARHGVADNTTHKLFPLLNGSVSSVYELVTLRKCVEPVQ
jgi:hypothetical protein